jgi:hypothetical protein
MIVRADCLTLDGSLSLRSLATSAVTKPRLRVSRSAWGPNPYKPRGDSPEAPSLREL